MGRTFNGTTQDIGVVGSNVTGPGITWSVAAWIKATAGANNSVPFYSEGLNGNANPFVWLAVSAANKATIFLRANGGGSSDNFVTTASVATGAWVHFCITQTAGNLLSTYVNGIPDATFTRTGNSSGATTLDRIGFAFFVTNGDSFWAGSIAHAASWSRTLAAQEAKELANGLLPSHLGPLHYWTLFGVDSPEPDIGTGTHNTSVMGNAPSFIAGPPSSLDLLTV